MRSLNLIVCVFVLIAAMVPGLAREGFCSPQSEEIQDVVKAARHGLPLFVQAIPHTDLHRFNFHSPQELGRATPGAPFRIFTIHPRDILNYDGQVPATDLVRPTEVWLVPVLVDGQSRLLLTVENTGGGWEAVSIGAAQLAMEWSRLGEDFPGRTGQDKIFVRIYQATSDLALVDAPAAGKAFIPLGAASQALGLAAGELYPPSDVIMSMKDVIRGNLEMGQGIEQER